MLLQLAQIVEQLDLALEHVRQGDASNARFALMLADNAVELVLHRLAQEKRDWVKSERWRPDWRYEHQSLLDAALGQDFGDKVKLAEALGFVSAAEAGSLRIGHRFRNETYHLGVQHEEILSEVAQFHFAVACAVLARLAPPYIGWRSGMTLPARAEKYFRRDGFGPGDYEAACVLMGGQGGHTAEALIAALFAHLSDVIDDQDECIDAVAKFRSPPTPRREVVIDTQAWAIAFSPEGAKYVVSKGDWAISPFETADRVKAEHRALVRKDPIPDWRGRAEKLGRLDDPHLALARYRAFMDSTQKLRGWLREAAEGVENEIQRQIDYLRGK